MKHLINCVEIPVATWDGQRRPARRAQRGLLPVQRRKSMKEITALPEFRWARKRSS